MIVRAIGLGAGGHAKVVIDALRTLGGYEIVGLLDPSAELRGTRVLGIEVIGDDSLLPELKNQGIERVFVGVGTSKDTSLRTRLYWQAVKAGLNVVSVVHPSAVVSPSARLGHGVTVMAGAIINAEARIGNNVIVNTAAVLEHDCVVGDHAHIATGARLGGGVHIGTGALVGLGCCIRPCAEIGNDSIVGAGAVVVDDVPDKVLAVGIPARTVRRLNSQ